MIFYGQIRSRTIHESPILGSHLCLKRDGARIVGPSLHLDIESLIVNHVLYFAQGKAKDQEDMVIMTNLTPMVNCFPQDLYIIM